MLGMPEMPGMLGVLGSRQVRKLSIRETRVKGIRPRVVVAAFCWVSLYLFRCQVLPASRNGGEASNLLGHNPLYPTYDKGVARGDENRL